MVQQIMQLPYTALHSRAVLFIDESNGCKRLFCVSFQAIGSVWWAGYFPRQLFRYADDIREICLYIFDNV
jgi:hypothetical protein